MTLFEGEQNGRYETDHLHMVLNEHIDFTEEGLSDDRKYSIFVHEYVHYYQHFATAENGAYPPNQNGLIHPQLSLKWA